MILIHHIKKPGKPPFKIQGSLIHLVLMLVITSCVTGNDDSQVLADHEAALDRTPRVLELKVDGETMKRDMQSNWIPIPAVAGDILDITAIMTTGNGALSSNLVISRYYYHSFTPFGLVQGVDLDYQVLDELEFGIGSFDLSFQYSVPAVDDDTLAFFIGDMINIAFWTTNDTGGVGYNDFNIVFE